ncbi:MAG TPA: hypothetical protein VGM92_08735 [Candidatus Kapabacteria bacterium]|jgi:hypothetical protein
MDHAFKIGDIVRLKRKNGSYASPDLTVIALQPQSVSVACHDDKARANGTASNFNGTYLWSDLELIAGTNTEAKAKRDSKTKPKAKKD